MNKAERAAKQKRYDTLCDQFDAWEGPGDYPSLPLTEQVRLYYELHPEQKVWDDDRTPAQMLPLPGEKPWWKFW